MPSLQETLTYEPQELAFGTSGLRGLVTVMTDLECYINASGFLEYLGKQGLPAGSTVYLAGDLRQSTPRITKAMVQAILAAGQQVVYCGLIPTPSLASYALAHQSACIMVTGSHIPDDRNGIKFYKPSGEVLKSDEAGIKAAVAVVRERLYQQAAEASPFNQAGELRQAPELPAIDEAAARAYHQRYTDVFDEQTLTGKQIIFYQHSAVGRDQLVKLLEALGAEVVPVGRSETFVPIDTENVTPSDQAYFKQLATEYPEAFAIVSTDGDSDRPFVIDEHGIFHRGDELGALVAKWLGADFAAFPVSANDAVSTYLTAEGIAFEHTKIGSPYVIEAMQSAHAAGHQRVVGWEVNGGFLLGAPIKINGKTLAALPTRDAIFPIIVALKMAAEALAPVSHIFKALPERYTDAGLIDNFPNDVSARIVATFSEDSEANRAKLARYFTKEEGFGQPTAISSLDGVRIFFDNGDIAHLRPSGNAPQLRIYSVAATAKRAQEIVRAAIAEPDGIFRRLEADLAA